MITRSVNRLESLGMIAGPALALVFFLLEPGGMIFDPAPSDDPVGNITALASNATMAHVTALGVPLGLILMLYGLAGINRVMEESTAAAMSRLGIMFMMVGAFGWIISSGLNHVLATTELASEQAIQTAIAIYKVDSGLTVMSGIAVASGFLTFNLGMAAMFPSGGLRIGAVVIAAVSLVALIALIIGQTTQNETMFMVSRACYFPWVVWSIVLGVKFFEGGEFTRIGRF